MRTVTKSKKAVFVAVIILFLYLFAEVTTFVGYGILNQTTFSWAEFESQRVDVLEKLGKKRKRHNRPQADIRKSAKRRSVEVLHPYIGYVIDHRDEDCPQYGFCMDAMKGDMNAPITAKSDDKLIVAIMGGSFAVGVSTNAHVIVQKLQQIPEFRDKEIVIHTIALGGFKQPQQLMALNYFLALGAHFDIIINIDGFNEIALPGLENVSKGVSPYYPRLWYNRVKGGRDEAMLLLLGKVALIKSDQEKAARRLSNSVWRYSVIGNLIWKYRNKRYERKIRGNEEHFIQYRADVSRTLSYVATGPEYRYQDSDTLLRDLARVWSKSSLQMHYVSQSIGAKYFHFLQPNQYVSGSKSMGDEEMVVARLDDHPYRRSVEQGYPKLQAEGKWLQQNGVTFYDLTPIFKDHNEPLYRDACCHVTAEGYEIINSRIADAITMRDP